MSEAQKDVRTFLSLEAKVNQTAVLERLATLRSGHRPGPIVVELDMTSFCDFECPECISASVLGTSRFTRQRLVELCEQMHELGVRAVILTGGGEPLRHHAANTVMESLTDQSIEVGLITNGYSLEKVPAELLRRVSWIRVSLDAGQPSTYARFRPHPQGESAFGNVLTGIQHAVKSGCPRVGVSFVLLVRGEGTQQVDNFDDVPVAAMMARNLGAKYLNVKAMQNEDHTVFAYSQSQVLRITAAVEDSRVYETDEFRLIASSNLESVLSREVEQTKSYERCMSIALRTLVTPEGMYPCAYHRGNERMRVPAEPQVDSFKTMWERAAAVHVDPRSDCRFHCARHQSNLELEVALASESAAESGGVEDWDLFI